MFPVLENMGLVLQVAGILVAFPIVMGFVYLVVYTVYVLLFSAMIYFLSLTDIAFTIYCISRSIDRAWKIQDSVLKGILAVYFHLCYWCDGCKGGLST